MSLPLTLANGDVGCEVAVHLSLDDLCRMHVSSQGLKRETKVFVARSDAWQRNVICELTPFITKKSLTDFLAKGPTWLNDFTSQVRIKLLGFDTDPETRTVRELHARIGNLNKTVRKEKQKLRRSPDELEEKVAKLRRTEAEKLNQIVDSIRSWTKGRLTATVSLSELVSVCSLQRVGSERDTICFLE